MADFGLFIGWGSARPGKEKAAGQLFQEAAAYWTGLQSSGAIESFELVVLTPHGGDLGGFALLRGEPQQLAGLRMTPEFRRLVQRASVCLDDLGTVDAFVDGGVMKAMQDWNEAIADLV